MASLSPAQVAEIRAAKQYIVMLAQRRDFMIDNIAALENTLAVKYDPATVAAVSVPGYPPK